MNEVLFLIVTLLLLSLITGLKMLVHVWGKKYRYSSAWELIYSKKEVANGHKRKKKGVGK
jgi:hypothetical protein